MVKTIKEIAKLANVSVSTISRVLNNMPDVNKETRQRVLEVIEEYGYIPNSTARTLKQNSTKFVCIIVKGMQNLFLLSILEHIQRKFDETVYIPLVYFIDERDNPFTYAKQLINEKKAEGVIFLGGNIGDKEDEIATLKVPCVFTTFSASELKLSNVSSVCVDDFQGSYSAVNYLLEEGHKKIAVLGGKRGQTDLIYNRHEGIVKCFEEHNSSFDEELYIESKFSLEDSHSAIKRRIDENGLDFTAIFAMSDIMAIGAIKAIFDCGYKVPEDVSIIGFDGIKIAKFLNPTLTTVSQPDEEIAEKSIELLIKGIKNGAFEHIVLGTELVIGKSVKNLDYNT